MCSAPFLLGLSLLEISQPVKWGAHHKLMVVTVGLLAVAAHVEVLADGAAEAGARLNLHLALVAGRRKGGRLGVVQVVQDHHAAVLGAAHAVELVVVALAEREELLHHTQTQRLS